MILAEPIRHTMERPRAGVSWLDDEGHWSPEAIDDWIAREVATGRIVWRGVEAGPGVRRRDATRAVVVERARRRSVHGGSPWEGRAVLVVVNRWSWNPALAESTEAAITAGRSILVSGYAYNF